MSDRPDRSAAVVAGLVLAGGLSSRMGARDKGLLDLDGTPLVLRVAQRLALQVHPCALSANGSAERWSIAGLPIVADPVPDHPGPLAGILAGLHWMNRAKPTATHLLSVAVDTPFFPVDLAQRLCRMADAETIVVARSAGRPHPVFSLWPRTSLPRIEASLAQGRRSLLGLVEAGACAWVDFGPVMIGDREVDPFFNINTPEDLDAARQILESAN